MESSVEASKSSVMSKPKPPLAPKPGLTPKPFSLQKNTTIRSIHAPKTVPATSKIQNSGPLTPRAQKTSQPAVTSNAKPGSQSELPKSHPTTTKASEAGKEETRDSSVGKTASQTSLPEETKKTELVQKDIIQTNNKASGDVATNSEQNNGKAKEDEARASVVKMRNHSGSDGASSTDETFRWGGARKRLSMELTSKFESGGLSLPPQPTITISTHNTKGDSNKPASPAPEQKQASPEQKQASPEPKQASPEPKQASPKQASPEPKQASPKQASAEPKQASPEPKEELAEPKQALPEPSNRESDDGGVKEDYTGGNSIKRRISQLFDSASRPEAMPKRDEPEILTGIGGVKERIKNWAAETSSEGPKMEKKPPATSRARSRSFEPATSPTAVKTPKTSNLRLSAEEMPQSPTVDPPSKVSPVEQPTKSPTEMLKGVRTEKKSSESAAESPQEANKSTEVDVQLHTPNLSEDVPKRDNVKRRSVRFGTVQSDDGGPPLILGSDSDSDTEEGEEEEEEEEEDEEEEEEESPGVTAEKKVPDLVPVFKRVGIFQKKHDESQQQEEERLKHLKFEEQWRAEEKEQARLQLEQEQKRVEEEKEKERERQREELRLKEEERARQKEEQIKQEMEERERLKEEERLRKERERQRLKEAQERDKELKLKQEEEEREKARQIEERLGEEQREKERLKAEAEEKQNAIVRKQEELLRERLRQEEDEERKRREQERKIQQEKEAEMERKRLLEKQKEEERREEERKIEKERLEKQEQERKMQEELERRQADQLKEKQRLEEERETKQSGLNNMQEESLVHRSKPHLNYFESKDWPQESKSPHSPSPNTSGPTENLMDVVYDDFSVKQNPINIEFDDFSVKPIKVISRRKTESSPVFRSWDDFLDIEEVKGLVPVDVKTENAKEDKMEKPEQCPNTPPLQEREWVEEVKDEPEEEQLISLDVKREEQLISLDVKREEQLISLDVEEEEEEKETETEDEDKIEEDNQEDQTNSFSTKNEDRDTDALIDFGLNHDQQDPVWEQIPERNSPQPVPDEVPEVSSEDTADDLKEPEFAPFPESSTPLLDTSAQRSKADLGKRRIRARPSRRLTAGLAQTETQDWGTQDSTVEKETVAKERESDSEEEQPKPKVVCSPSQRVPVFPGMSPAGLLAQLKRKTGGGGTGVKEETVESKASEEKEHQDEEVAPSSVELSHSPRTPARLAGATRVLPLIGNKEEGGASSPAWLKELKSKKRMSQHGSDA